MYFLSILFMFLSGVVAFNFTHSRLLMALFSLEFLILFLFMSFFFYFLVEFGYELYFLLIFLTFSVCESALGLGVLVNMVRSHGNDLVSSLSVMSW